MGKYQTWQPNHQPDIVYTTKWDIWWFIQCGSIQYAIVFRGVETTNQKECQWDIIVDPWDIP